jgi:hypothetical protein
MQNSSFYSAKKCIFAPKLLHKTLKFGLKKQQKCIIIVLLIMS